MGERVGYIRDRGINHIRHREMVLEYVRQFGAIANRQCQELCGLSRDQATKLLKQLVEQGDLEMTGKGRGAQYVLPNAEAQRRN